MEAHDTRSMTFEDYLALDRGSEQRWEYVDGEVWAMAGASLEHNVVAGALYRALGTALSGRDCFVLIDGQKIATPTTRSYHYPDVSVVCGKIAIDAKDEHAITNPSVLVEVLSPTTADYDRGRKFAHYRSIAALREYVLVDLEARLVEHHRRLETGQWLMTELRDTAVRLESLDVAIAWDDVWSDHDRLADARG